MPEEGSKVSMKSDGRNASHDQRNKRNSAPFPVPISALHLRQMGVLRVTYAVVTSALFGVAPTSAQPEAIRCLPPEAPMTELPADVLAEYRAEIALVNTETDIPDHDAGPVGLAKTLGINNGWERIIHEAIIPYS